MKIISIALGLTLITLLASGCASSRSGKVYSRDQARTAHSVDFGTVMSVERVQIEGTKSPAGAITGGVAGGVVGSTIGSGGGSRIAAAAGAIAGGLAGTAAEEKATRKAGLEITVELDNGRMMVVVQEADEEYEIGEKIRILEGSDGTTRVRKL